MPATVASGDAIEQVSSRRYFALRAGHVKLSILPQSSVFLADGQHSGKKLLITSLYWKCALTAESILMALSLVPEAMSTRTSGKHSIHCTMSQMSMVVLKWFRGSRKMLCLFSDCRSSDFAGSFCVKCRSHTGRWISSDQ